MTVAEIARLLGLSVIVEGNSALTRVKSGYTGDLLSDVMAHAGESSIWMTIQTHQNIVAVAVVTGVTAIVICGGRSPEPDTIEKARREGVTLLGASEPAFVVTGKVYRALTGD